MNRVTTFLRAAAPAVARDAIGGAGFLLVIAGIARFSIGGAMIVAGLILVGLCIAWARTT